MKDPGNIVVPPGTKVPMTRLPGLEPATSEPPASVARKPVQARYTKPGPDGMNKLERRYAGHLAALKAAGGIYDFAFEPEKFRLANVGDTCFYTPDFRVQMNDGTIEFHDTKGFMRDDANVKMKWFVQQHPYPLVIVRWVKKTWEFERREP